MNDANLAQFLSNGLNFESSVAAQLVDILKKTNCLLLGLAGGVGLTVAGLKDMNKLGQTGQIAPSRNMGLQMILAGMTVGTIAVGGMCKAVKLKILSYTDEYSDAGSAIRRLTPEKKVELQSDARKLLAMKDNIEKMFEQEKQTGINPDLVA